MSKDEVKVNTLPCEQPNIFKLRRSTARLSFFDGSPVKEGKKCGTLRVDLDCCRVPHCWSAKGLKGRATCKIVGLVGRRAKKRDCTRGWQLRPST